jgi:hypothetical protein
VSNEDPFSQSSHTTGSSYEKYQARVFLSFAKFHVYDAGDELPRKIFFPTLALAVVVVLVLKRRNRF